MKTFKREPILTEPDEDDYDDGNIPEIDLPRQSDTTFVSPDRIFTEDGVEVI